MQVAMHFETAPSMKAENAEREAESLSVFLIFSFSSLFFNWSKAVYWRTRLCDQKVFSVSAEYDGV